MLLGKLSTIKSSFIHIIGVSSTTATSKIAALVSGFQPLILVTKNYIVDVALVIDTPLVRGIALSTTKLIGKI